MSIKFEFVMYDRWEREIQGVIVVRAVKEDIQNLCVKVSQKKNSERILD